MLRKSQLHFRKSLTIWSFVLIILVSSVYVEAAKAPRRSGQKGKPNHDAIALSYGGSRKTGTVQQHQTKQVYPQAASAPPLPNNNNNKPIGWNIPASNTPVQQKTVSNTNSGFQTPAHNTGYASAPPVYGQSGGFNAPSNSGPPPAYSAPNTGYPQQGVHTLPQGGYNPQQSNVGYNPQQGYHPQPNYPQGVNNPNPSYQQPMGYNGQQTPVINNYYQQPQTGGTGSSLAKNALLLGAGGLAGAAIYGALKPGEETKTVIIHDTVPSQPPNLSPDLAATAPATVQASETNVPLAQAPSNIQLPQPSTVVPLAPMPDTTGISQSIVPIMPGSEATIATEPIVPLAPMPDSPSIPLVPMPDSLPKVTEQRSSNNNTTNAEIPVSTSIPLASFPEVSPSSQAHLKGHATHLKAFNISVYAAISMILATILI